MTLRIGTRRSPLALVQAEEVRRRLAEHGTDAEIVPMSTSGDEGAPSRDAPAGLKGLFVDTILDALERDEIDIAVHSAKDLPAEDDEGLVIAAVPPRVDPADVLVLREASLPPGAVIGTSSIRRRAQLLRAFPGVTVDDLRGNVDTRLRKVGDGTVDAAVLALAGLIRLGVTPPHSAPLGSDVMVPAPGQGALALQARADDLPTLTALAPLDHFESRCALEAERSLMWRLGGSCALPLGAIATVDGGRIEMLAVVIAPDGSRVARVEVVSDSPEGAAALATKELIAEGAEEILEALEDEAMDDRGVKPLAGRTVLVTRPADQSIELVRYVRALGSRAIVAPAIEIVPIRSAALTRAMRELSAGGFAWITLTSRATVEMLASRLADPKDVRANVAAIGEGTGAAFRAWARRKPDLMPATFTTVGLARAFPRGEGRVLCARADIAPPGLEDALAAKGWSPERVDAYRTRMARSLPAEARTALRDGDVDAITFTSASTVRGFVGAMGVVRGNPKVVAIGPVTAAEARAHGLRVSAVAQPHTINGLVAALERVLGARR